MSWSRWWAAACAAVSAAATEGEQLAASLYQQAVAGVTAILADLDPVLANLVSEAKQRAVDACASVTGGLKAKTVAMLTAWRDDLQGILDSCRAGTYQANGALIQLILANLPAIIAAITEIISLFGGTPTPAPAS